MSIDPVSMDDVPTGTVLDRRKPLLDGFAATRRLESSGICSNSSRPMDTAGCGTLSLLAIDTEVVRQNYRLASLA